MATMEMDLTFACPQCGKKYVWKSTLAGKKVRCKKCESSFRMPADPPLEGEAETDELKKAAAKGGKTSATGSPNVSASRTGQPRPARKKAAANLAGGDGAGAMIDAAGEANPYDIDDPEDAPKEAAKVPCRECDEQISAKSVICTHCGTNQRTGEKVRGEGGKSKKNKAGTSSGGGLGALVKLAVAVALLGGAAASYFLWMK